MVNSSLADFCVRLEAGLRNKVAYVHIPYTKLNLRLLWLFMQYGCISSFSVDSDCDGGCLFIKVGLKYVVGRAVLTRVELISKPGLRIYLTLGELAKKFSRNSFQGFFVLSTSEGLCTSTELLLARTLSKKLSGEVLLRVAF